MEKGKETKYICPFCGARMRSEFYGKPPRMEIYCAECNKFCSDCALPSKVMAECEATCEISTIN